MTPTEHSHSIDNYHQDEPTFAQHPDTTLNVVKDRITICRLSDVPAAELSRAHGVVAQVAGTKSGEFGIARVVQGRRLVFSLRVPVPITQLDKPQAFLAAGRQPWGDVAGFMASADPEIFHGHGGGNHLYGRIAVAHLAQEAAIAARHKDEGSLETAKNQLLQLGDSPHKIYHGAHQQNSTGWLQSMAQRFIAAGGAYISIYDLDQQKIYNTVHPLGLNLPMLPSFLAFPEVQFVRYNSQVDDENPAGLVTIPIQTGKGWHHDLAIENLAQKVGTPEGTKNLLNKADQALGHDDHLDSHLATGLLAMIADRPENPDRIFSQPPRSNPSI